MSALRSNGAMLLNSSFLLPFKWRAYIIKMFDLARSLTGKKVRDKKALWVIFFFSLLSWFVWFSFILSVWNSQPSRCRYRRADKCFTSIILTFSRMEFVDSISEDPHSWSLKKCRQCKIGTLSTGDTVSVALTTGSLKFWLKIFSYFARYFRFFENLAWIASAFFKKRADAFWIE